MSEQLNKLAADFFASNPGKDVVYATSNGALFLSVSARDWHARQNNADKISLFRKDVCKTEETPKEEKKSRKRKKSE